MRALLVAVAAIVLAPGAARAEQPNWMIGPVLGLRVGGHPGERLVLGFEGGLGYGPERINVGLEYRDRTSLGYIELDPWYLIGGSFGVGIDTNGDVQGILGIWEGVPLALPSCNQPRGKYVSLSIGLRWSGVTELYTTLKAGVGPPICFGG